MPVNTYPEVESLRTGYTIEDDRLYLSRYGMGQTWDGESLAAIIYAYGDFEEALVADNELPFTPERGLPILAALEDGTIVYEWEGNPCSFAPGEVWQIIHSTDHGKGCVVIDTSSLMNHGLWDEDHLEIEQ